MFYEINSQFNLMIDRLNKIDIPYNNLKNILIPQKDKKEIGFIFDSMQIMNSCYGDIVLKTILPHILKIEKVAIFFGDIIGPENQECQNNLMIAFKREIIGKKNLNFRNISQYFIVYLNNMTECRINALEKVLNDLPYYIGYLDLTFQTVMKNIISTSIGQKFLKYKNIIMMPTDEKEDEDSNYCLFDFKKHNLIIRNIDTISYSTFLCFKIFRSYYDFDENDLILSLNAITDEPALIRNYDIEIDMKKYNYLMENKKGSLEITGLNIFNLDQFKKIISTMINRNYIFNISLDKDHNCIKFNTILEFINTTKSKKEKYIISFEYLKAKETLRLITMY